MKFLEIKVGELKDHIDSDVYQHSTHCPISRHRAFSLSQNPRADKDDPAVAASRSYVGMKSKTATQSGLSSMMEEFPSTITTAEMYEKLEQWNNDSSISILMFQLPFGGKAGKEINTTLLCNRINLAKDGDGLNQVTLGLMSLGADRYYDCCTPSGMVDLASVYLIREKGAKLRPEPARTDRRKARDRRRSRPRTRRR